jgi:hypothetical protein
MTRKTTSLEGLTEVNKILIFKHFQKTNYSPGFILGLF